MIGRVGGEGGGFGMRYAVNVSPLPARGGQGFLFPVQAATLFLFFSQGRETIKEELPPPFHDSLDRFAYAPCPGKADPYIPSYAPWEPLPFTSK